jgi:RecB family exonuclease
MFSGPWYAKVDAVAEIHFILGRTLADRTEALGAFSIPTDRVGRPSLLALRPTHRALRFRQEVAASKNQFLPKAWVLDDFLAEVARRRSGGRAILSGPALAIRLGAFSSTAELPVEIRDNLNGPQRGQQLASIFSRVEEAGPKSPTLPLWMATLFADFRAELAGEKRWISLGSAIRQALKGLKFTDPDCADLFQGFHSVLLEDPQGLSLVRTALLLEITRLWSNAGIQVLVSLASPIPVGSEALLDFFTGEEESATGLRQRAFDANARFRRSAFEAWVGQGSTRFFWAEGGGVHELEPGFPTALPITPCIADGLYQAQPPQFEDPTLDYAREHVQLSTPATPFHECTQIARQIKAGWLERRWDLSEVLIAVPDLPAYAPTLIQVFRDHGLPLDLSSGKHLIRSPIGTLLASLLRLSEAGNTPEDFCDLLANAPTLPDLPLPIETILQQIRCAQVRGGRPSLWMQDVSLWLASKPGRVSAEALTESLAALDSLFSTCVQPLQDAQTPIRFLDALEDGLRGIGLPGALLHTDASAQLQAWRSTLELLQACRRDFLSIENPVVDKAWCLATLNHQLALASFRPGQANPAAVSVVGCLELRGLTPKHLWLAGLYRGAFPASTSPPPLVERSLWAKLQWINPLGEARSLLGAALRTALIRPDHTLAISWPQQKEAREMRPSPPVKDFINLCSRLGLAFRDQNTVSIGLAHSEFRQQGLSSAPEPGQLSERMLAQQTRETERSNDPISRFDGRLGHSFDSKDTPLSVTRIERFIQCPARDWYANGLGLGALDERNEDASPLTVGTLLHGVLEEFVRQNLRAYQTPKGTFKVLAKKLADIAETALNQPTIQPSMSQDARQGLREKWLPGLLDEGPKGLLATWLELDLGRAPSRSPIAVEMDLGELRISGRKIKGRMDRVDAIDTHGLLVVDYKTGTPPSTKRLVQGLALQGFLYSEAAKRKWPKRTQSASVYTQIGKADGIVDKGWMGDPELIKSLANRAKCVGVDAGFEAELMDHIAHAVDGLSAGQHHTTLADPADVGCEYCDFRTLCRYTPARAEQQSQRPESCGPMEDP